MPLTNLKPAFYRVAGTLAVQSGWINEATGDICDTEEGDFMAIRVVPNASLAFTIGQRWEFTAPVDLSPYAFVAGSERCHVASIDKVTGEVGLLLEGIHNGLDGNLLVIVPFHDDAVLARLVEFKPKRCVRTSPSLLWVGAVFAVTVPLAYLMTLFFPPHTASILMGVAVVCTAIILGQSHAVLLALAFPLARNLLIVPPALAFSIPTADEYVRAATWVAMALLVPWLCSSAKAVRRTLLNVEGTLSKETEATKQ
jgi:hypothetical protein